MSANSHSMISSALLVIFVMILFMVHAIVRIKNSIRKIGAAKVSGKSATLNWLDLVFSVILLGWSIIVSTIAAVNWGH